MRFCEAETAYFEQQKRQTQHTLHRHKLSVSMQVNNMKIQTDIIHLAAFCGRSG